ncbi:glutamine amidotransferase [candidate division WWE3 bacterium CG08_land_8_20_14_0_20_41_15]|uniref:Lipid II isoglutaminyl synthase (glutamine-hydrolyzing) subunit GatD n=1 Tax=candidate division WWE3 bacterium CG08_land_8_20_14_0_20_41_15 TaxID=1975086 RepID=A0A2H0X9G0_UNCKA|nr:MAG: glutamine amidotransferase [candidate division WWE3 bacterium CG08_land_8_20_14_0_20_41_15]
MNLKIGWLYPDLLNLYGDRGNIECLMNRLKWRDISVDLIGISLKDKNNFKEIDILFSGGGPDLSQKLVAEDFLHNKGDYIREFVENDGVGLYICGSFQLLGKYYRPYEGEDLKGLSVFDMYTEHFGLTKPRLVGNVVVSCDIFKDKENTLVGFENHGGRTFLGANLSPLGKVIHGFGNNGEDKTEGAVYKNSIGTYLHGPLLPKNPHLADLLIEKALKKKYGKPVELSGLDDTLEWSAHKNALHLS